MSFKFGDIIINHWAADRNPLKVGIVISQAPNKDYALTDGRGEYWTMAGDKETLSRVERVGRLDLTPFNEAWRLVIVGWARK